MSATDGQQVLDGEEFSGLSEEIETRQTDVVMLRVVYDRHPGDVELTGGEWAFRLRLGGIDVHEVDIDQPTAKIERRDRAEPRQ